MFVSDGFMGLGFTQDGEMVFVSHAISDETVYIKMGDGYGAFQIVRGVTAGDLVDGERFRKWNRDFYPVYRMVEFVDVLPEQEEICVLCPMISFKEAKIEFLGRVKLFLEDKLAL